MFFDDLKLVEEAVSKYGPVTPEFVEVGGIPNPTIADYSRTIEAVRLMRNRLRCPTCGGDGRPVPREMKEIQLCRYHNIHRPLDPYLPGYVCEDPENEGASIETLAEKYPHAIGCLVCLSTLEHCEEVWYAPEHLHDAMKPGGLLIVGVPFLFPFHPSPKDLWRFSPQGLEKLFESPKGAWEILWCDWRLKIGGEAGVLNVQDGKPQIVESCGLIARAR